MRWIIGDIHGMFRMLRALLDAVMQRDADAKFYFVGDYVNRGPESKQVVDLLLTMTDAKFVRGNHDEIFDLILNAPSIDPSPEHGAAEHAFRTFLQFGLDATLASYGIDADAIHRVAHQGEHGALDALLGPIPPSHRQFFRALPLTIDEPDFFIAHAKWGVDVENDSAIVTRLLADPKQQHAMVWDRYLDNEIRRNKPWSRQAYFGHTPVATYAAARKRDAHAPIFGPRITLLDTGAALSVLGRLTAVCADDQTYVQINRQLTTIEGSRGK